MQRGITALNCTSYAVSQMWAFAAVLFLLFVFRFFALRAKKRKTDKTVSTMLPQAKTLGVN
jgi:hypothetical protein